jgi:hypothetical protein
MTVTSIAARSVAPSIEGRLLDPKQAQDYRVRVADNVGQIQIQHINVAGELISYQTLDADEAYRFAMQILKGYDRLEGL